MDHKEKLTKERKLSPKEIKYINIYIFSTITLILITSYQAVKQQTL